MIVDGYGAARLAVSQRHQMCSRLRCNDIPGSHAVERPDRSQIGPTIHARIAGRRSTLPGLRRSNRETAHAPTLASAPASADRTHPATRPCEICRAARRSGHHRDAGRGDATPDQVDEWAFTESIPDRIPPPRDLPPHSCIDDRFVWSRNVPSRYTQRGPRDTSQPVPNRSQYSGRRRMWERR